MSKIGAAIDEVIRLGLAPLMKKSGYRKSARNFHKQLGSDWQVVNVQGSQYNYDDEGRFTVNLGVYIASISELEKGRSLQGKPTVPFCTVQERLGLLMPVQKDYWWSLGPESDLPGIAQEVADAVEQFGLPWLDAFLDPAQVAAFLKYSPSLTSMAAALAMGDHEEARRRLLWMIQERPAGTDFFNSWAQKQGLDVGT